MTIDDALKLAREALLTDRLDEAERLCASALTISPDNAMHSAPPATHGLEEAKTAEAWYLLGVVRLRRGDLWASEECFAQALSLQPQMVEAHIERGWMFKALAMPEEAIECYRRACELAPQSATALCNLANLLLEKRQFDEAVACYRRAIEVEPGRAEFYYNLGSAYLEQRRLSEAAATLERAIELQPAYAEAYYNLGIVRRDQGAKHEAARCFQQAANLKDELADGRVAYALEALADGDFERGWPEYEWRWKTGKLRRRMFDQPRWAAEPIAGKTILLHAEQGLGDTLQFVRYAQIVQRLGARVVFEAPRRLLRLLASTPGIDALIGQGDELPPFDVFAPLVSVPGILGTRPDTIPAEVPYIFADPQLVEHWRQRLTTHHSPTPHSLRIGINWRGRGQGFWRARNIPLAQFAKLAAVHGVSLINLHAHASAEELAEGSRLLGLVNLGTDVDSGDDAFVDTAAIIQNLDLVITSDTALAHLAGALGARVWLGLPKQADWRWLRERTDSPWYPTMRLFRQHDEGDWAAPMEQMATELTELLKTMPAASQ